MNSLQALTSHGCWTRTRRPNLFSSNVPIYLYQKERGLWCEISNGPRELEQRKLHGLCLEKKKERSSVDDPSLCS